MSRSVVALRGYLARFGPTHRRGFQCKQFTPAARHADARQCRAVQQPVYTRRCQRGFRLKPALSRTGTTGFAGLMNSQSRPPTTSTPP
jgi:hypothetical protein